MKILFLTLALVASLPSLGTPISCGSQLELDTTPSENDKPSSYGIRCPGSQVDGIVSPYTTPNSIEILLQPGSRQITVNPTCGNMPCNLQQIQMRRFDQATLDRIRQQGGGQSWTNLYVGNITFNNPESIKYLVSARDVRPSSVNLTQPLTEQLRRNMPLAASPGRNARVNAEIENDEYSACHFTDPRTGNDVPPRIVTEEGRNSCGAPPTRLCRGVVRCFSQHYGRRLTGEGFCRANPDSTCPGADECINNPEISEIDSATGSSTGSGRTAGGALQ